MGKLKFNKKQYKETVNANINLELSSLTEEEQALVSIPDASERQQDLLYLTAVLVSSGTNKNGAVFLGSELAKAKGTIKHKAVDIEHDERSIIGQITGSGYIDSNLNSFQVPDLIEESEVKKYDDMDMDILISAIIHAYRFPDLSDEILKGEWKVSMECFYTDYDIKIGDFIIPREIAETKGLTDKVGKVVRLTDSNKEVGFFMVGRVLRNITFSGVGIVKNPANDKSIILEAASVKEYIQSKEEDAFQLDINTLMEEVAAEDLKINKIKLKVLSDKEEAYNYIPSAGTCVNYKRRSAPRNVMGNPSIEGDENPPSEMSNHCSLFDRECTAPPGNALAPACLRNVLKRTVREAIHDFSDIVSELWWNEQFSELENNVDDAETILDK